MDWRLAQASARGGHAARGRGDGRGPGARGHRHRGPGARLPEGRRHPARGELLLALRRPLRPGASGHGPGRAARPFLGQVCAGSMERVELGLYGDLREIDVQADPSAAACGRARAARCAASVTLVNARALAEERGIDVLESTSPAPRGLRQPDGAAPQDERGRLLGGGHALRPQPPAPRRRRRRRGGRHPAGPPAAREERRHAGRGRPHRDDAGRARASTSRA